MVHEVGGKWGRMNGAGSKMKDEQWRNDHHKV